MILFSSSLKRRLGAALAATLLAGGSAEAAPALWAASDKDSTVYLFGTAHAVRPTADWRTPELEKAIKSSAALWLEVQNTTDQAAQMALIQKFGLDPAAPLPSKLSETQKAKLTSVLAALGLPEARVAPMRPWFAGATIGMLSLAKAGIDPKAGADWALRDTMTAKGSPVDGFDTGEQQIRYLADLPEAEQIAFLEDVLDRAAQGAELSSRIADGWEKGDTEALNAIVHKEMKERTPALYTRLIPERNKRYAARIKELLAGNKDQLVAVGVGHLVGPDSVQAMLQAEGITFKRIQ